ncbi:unnamed protein product [Blepharisma stoltei]|uniref:LITAF domain-containing protein n=1 Tax=Blepharisma stoltei TaxID=1481888 RepID=A0AAU9ISG5_9CILI|nr:unnamed protein product [Blepharisma stoltei]
MTSNHNFFGKHIHSKSSTDSINTQISSLNIKTTGNTLHNFDSNKIKSSFKSDLGEEFHSEANNLSMDISYDPFEFPLKSIFPATCHFSKTKRKHRRYLSTPMNFVPSNFLFSYTKRRTNSKDREPSERSISPIVSDLKNFAFCATDDGSTLNSKRQNANEDDKSSETFNVEPTFKVPFKTVLHKGIIQKRMEREKNNPILPVLGSNPCTAYCEFCKMDVHTTVILRNSSVIVASFMELVHNLFGCCSNSIWLNRMRYHRCSNCGTVLGRSCI